MKQSTQKSIAGLYTGAASAFSPHGAESFNPPQFLNNLSETNLKVPFVSIG